MLQLLKVFVWAILQVKPPQYLRISMRSKNNFECHWWCLRQIAWLEVIHEPRQKVHVCKIASTRKVYSPKVYLCILFFVGGKNHSDVSLVIRDRAFDNWTKNRIFCQKWFELVWNEKKWQVPAVSWNLRVVCFVLYKTDGFCTIQV